MLPLNGIDENTSHGTTRAIGSVNVQVHIAADKLGIDYLRAHSSERFANWADVNWESPAFVGIMQEVIS